MEKNIEFDWRWQSEQISKNFRSTASPEVLAITNRANGHLRNSDIAATASHVAGMEPDFTLPNTVGRAYYLV